MTLTSTSVVQEGEILAAKYRVERVLGVGGMGVVVAAEHLQLGEKVALKFLLPDALQNPEVVSRFEREARAAVRIKSEHVARVIDVGALPNGAPYMVMEYLDGKDLSGVLLEAGPLPVRDAVDYVLQACVAVAEAHSHGIIHRDLKPANLFRVKRRDGHALIKVLDFGISKLTQASGETGGAATKTALVMGSPAYMSPEQMQSTKLVDERTDIWALGVILYELATGKKPFDGEQYAEICIKVATQEQPPASTMVSSVPQAFDDVVRKCLAKRREDRFRDIGELARALAPLASKEERALVGRIAGSLGPSAQTGPMEAEHSSSAVAAPVATGGAWGQPTSAHSRPPVGTTGRVAKYAAGVVAFIAIAGAVGWRLGSSDHSNGDGSSPTTAGGVTAAPPPPAPVHARRAPVSAATLAPLPAVSVAPVVEEVAVPSPSRNDTAPAPPRPDVAPMAPPQATAAAKPEGKPAGTLTASPPGTPLSPPAAAAKGPSKHTAPPPAAGADPCSPDYFYDANGKKVFKKECFK